MRTLSLVFVLSSVSFYLPANELVLILPKDFQEVRQAFSDPGVMVHYYDDQLLIATAEPDSRSGQMLLLDETPWQAGYSYYCVFLDQHSDKEEYLSLLEHRVDVLYDGSHFLVVRSEEGRYGQLLPARNDGMIRIFPVESRLPADSRFDFPEVGEADPFIEYLLDQVDGELITDRVQHMENYGTRDAYEPESVMAQQWITAQFNSWGLDVEVMDFFMPGGPSSDNVIATLTGTTSPDEYVIVGAHYDSISWWGDAPGADDNASGTAGVMEIAQILSQYEFDRSIVFAAWSGEEYGLFGSAAYAQRSAMQGKNILGYINMDMIGYLEPGHTTIMSSLIYPASAQALADFYTEVAALYLPDFLVVPGTLTGGTSDHASFNNHGYMGIFPFEDADNYSPYIHTPNDLVGLSYNHEEQAVIFTQAAMAAVVSLAGTEGSFDTHLLAIPAGWSGISSQVQPAEANIELLFASIEDQMVAVQNLDDTYWPDSGINTLNTWGFHAAFKIKMEEEASLEIHGQLSDDNSLHLDQGWNLMPVLSQSPVEVSGMFQHAVHELELIKEIGGESVYWPAQDISTLGYLLPGRAYMVKANADFGVSFPDDAVRADAHDHPDAQDYPGAQDYPDAQDRAGTQYDNTSRNTPWSIPVPTGSSHLIAIPSHVVSAYAPGDYIGAFTPGGLAAGILRLENLDNNQYLVVYANDSLEVGTNAFMEGESISLLYHDSSNDLDYHLLVSWDDQFPHGGIFFHEGISGISALEIDQTGIAETITKSRIYPNPARRAVTVSLSGTEGGRLSIRNASNQTVLETDIMDELQLDLGHLRRGIYFFHIKGMDHYETHKVIIY